MLRRASALTVLGAIAAQRVNIKMCCAQVLIERYPSAQGLKHRGYTHCDSEWR